MPSADTPSTAIDRGSSRRLSFSIGRAGIAPRGGGEPAAAVERHQPLLAERERVDLQLGDIRARRRRDPTQKRCASSMNARKHRSSSPSETMRRWPRARPAASRTRRWRGTDRGTLPASCRSPAALATARPGRILRREILGVDAAEPGRDHRPELAGRANAHEELVAEPGPRPLDELDDQHAAHVGRARDDDRSAASIFGAHGLPVLAARTRCRPRRSCARCRAKRS